jgi:2'-5' RNA ligase
VRLFVAGYPPAPVVEHLAEQSARLHTVRAGARVARTDTWHVTLAFLGELPEERLVDVAYAVDLAATGAAVAPTLSVSGGGTFGRGRSTVLWAGLTGAVPELLSLAGAVRRALGRARLPYDRRPARPHLTLARPGDRVPAELVAADVAELAGYQGPQWTLDRVLVMESRLGAVAEYAERHSVPVAGAVQH